MISDGILVVKILTKSFHYMEKMSRIGPGGPKNCQEEHVVGGLKCWWYEI